MKANGKGWAYKRIKTWINKECIAIDSPRKDDKINRSHPSLIIKTKAMEKHNQDLKERQKEERKEQDAKVLKGF